MNGRPDRLRVVRGSSEPIGCILENRRKDRSFSAFDVVLPVPRYEAEAIDHLSMRVPRVEGDGGGRNGTRAWL